MGRSSVFSLEQIYRKQVVGTWSKIPEVFRYVNSVVGTANPYGYARNGSNSGIDRIDFNNDTVTASAKGSMATGDTQYESGFGNLNYGYITGGKGSGPGAYPANWATTSISRIDYSNDATAASPKGPYSTPVYSHGGVGNNDYGYSIAGQDFGYPPPAVKYSTIVRMDYSNDTVSPPAKSNYPYEGGGFGMSGTGNMDYGWIANGISNNSIVHRIDYSSDTVSPPSRTYLDRYGNQGRKCTGNASYGYWQGGNYETKFSRVDFSNDTATGVTKGSAHQAYENGSVTSKDYAYLYGVFFPYTSLVERMDYSNDDIAASPKGPLSVTLGGGKSVAGCSAQQFGLPTAPVPATRTESGAPTPIGTDYGYIGGGHGPSRFSSIDRIDIANDTATALVKGKMTVERRGHAGTGSLTHGYQGGYDVNAGNSSVSRIDFSNDTADAAVVGRMSFASPGGAAASGNKDFGYFVGGGGNLSNVSRVDYSNDSSTQSPKGPLAAGMWYLGGTGNQSFGYFVGGYPAISTLNRIDYGNDTATAATKGNQSTGRYGQGASGNASYAYFSGGRSSSVLSTVDRLDYSNDTPNMVVKGPLSSTGYYISSFGNSEYGWHCARRPDKSVVDRIDFANDTATASIRGPLTAIRKYAAASSSRQYNNPTTSSPSVIVDKGADGYTTSTLGPAYGYIGGGWVPAHGGKTTVDRIDFGNDTATASPKGPLANAAAGRGATGSTAYGYWGGGSTPSLVTHVDRIDYGNDTATASPKGNLSQAKKNLAGVGNNSLGYMAGGQIGGYTASAVDRISFATDTATASPKGNLSGPIKWNMATGNQSFGYVGSGESPGPYVTTINRIDYSSDTETTPTKGPLTLARFAGAATGNASFGYFGGGFVAPSGSNKSTVDRLDYSSDTTTAVAKGPLSSARHYLSATGDTSYGYFAGGWYSEPAIRSIVDRVDYSSDTPTASPKGALSRSDAKFAGASARANANASVSFIPRIKWVDSQSEVSASSLAPAFGYFHGGNPGYTKSRIDRLDFSNDTDVCVEKGPLSVGRGYHASASNKDYGYWAGGYDVNISPRYMSNVDRLDYSNDTPTTSPKGPISYARYYLGGTGNASYAYFGGGVPHGSSTSYVDRLDYSNDTATATQKGNLSFTVKKQGVTGNPSFGYYGGGTNGSAYFTTMNRIDYSNDTATATVKGPVSIARQQLTATGNTSFGYFIGGDGPSIPSNNSSWVDRLDYSNDTTAASVRGYLSAGTNDAGATGNPSFGYAGGGDTGPTSTLHRIDYSNDSATALARTTLGSTNYGQRAVSGQENGLLPTAIVQSPYLNPAPAGGGGSGSWSILMHSSGAKGSSSEGGATTKWGNTGQTAWQSLTAASTSADGRTAFGDGSGLYNGFFTTTNITKMALVDGSGSMTDMTSHTNYLTYDLVGTGTGSETMYEILHRLDQYNLNNPSWAGGPGDSLFGTDSCTDFVAGTAVSGNLTATSDTWLASNPAAPAPLSPSPSTTTQPHSFCIWGVNRDSDNDTQVLCAYSGDLSVGCGKADSWRGNTPYQTFWSYWGNDWHSNSQTQTISKGKQSDPGVGGAAPYNGQYGVYLMAFSGSGGGGAPSPQTPNIPVPAQLPYAGPVPNGPAHGYVGGGRPPINPGNTDIDRIDYSNDTATASPKGNMSGPNYNYAAVASTTHGYFAGGNTPSLSSAVNRLDFANDTATPIARGNLSHDRADGVRGAGNDLFGYIMGSSPSIGTRVTRIQYYNDTATSAPKGNLAFAQNDHGATGNQNYAWNSQGTPSCISRVQRVDYANDTSTAVEKGNSGIAVERNGGVGNADYGYFGGGSTSPWSNRSEVYRVDYSNDTATSSRKGDLSQARYVSLASFGSNSYGYFAGGSSPSNSTRVDRIDYSNDTATMAVKGPLTSGRYMAGGFSGQENGLPQ